MSSLARLFDYSLPITNQISFLCDVLSIIKRGYLTNDIFVNRLEKTLENYFLPKKAVCVTSGTSALQVLFSSYCNPEDHIIMPNNTFIATWQAARVSNLNVHIVDTNETGIGICPKHLEYTLTRLQSESIKPKAIIDVHIGGFISRYWQKCKNLADKFDCLYLEDSAQAFGAKTICGIKAGCIGDSGIHSFHLTKVLTGGEGGLVLSNNDMVSSLRSLRQFGVSELNPLLHNLISLNSKMTEFTAAFILQNLKVVEKKIRKRRQLMSFYKAHLHFDKFFVYDDHYMNSFSSAYKTIVRVKDVDSYNRILSESSKVPLTGFVYKYPLSLQTVVRNDDRTYFVEDELRESILFSNTHICPPNYPELPISSAKKICGFLNNIA